MSFYTRTAPLASMCPRCRQSFTVTRRPLTKRQAELLAFIREYVGAHGYAPSFEEMAEQFRYTSLATVHEHLSNLERKGYIVRDFNRARSIELVEPSPVLSERLAQLSRVCEAYRLESARTDEFWDDAVMEDFLNTFDTETVGWLIEMAARAEAGDPTGTAATQKGETRSVSRSDVTTGVTSPTYDFETGR